MKKIGRTYKRDSFTLLEVVVSLFIITIVGAMTGSFLLQSASQKRFSTNIQKFEMQVDYCRMMSQVYEKDMALFVKKTEKGFQTSIYYIQKMDENDSSIRKISFEHFHVVQKEDPFSLRFSSTGEMIGPDELQFSDGKRSQKISFHKTKSNLIP